MSMAYNKKMFGIFPPLNFFKFLKFLISKKFQKK